MRAYIQIRIMLIAAAAVVLTAFFCTVAYYRVFNNEVFNDLQTYAHLAGASLGDKDGERTLSYAFLEETLAKERIRLTFLAEDGEVIYDSMEDPASLDNHSNREEIKEALRKGSGSSTRRSDSFGQTNFYYAIRLNSGRILRVSQEARSIFGIFLHAVPAVTLIVLVLVAICYFLSRLVINRFLEPIRALSLNMDNPDETGAYEELRPIIGHMLAQHQEILRNASLRQEFTTNVTHELKTPLTAITGYAQLIESGIANDSDMKDFGHKIRMNADRLLGLINDTLHLSEVDVTAGEKLEKETVDLRSAALICAEMLEGVARDQDVTIRVEGKPAPVCANRLMIDELIYNLCDNAIRYNKKGGEVVVTTSPRTLSVRDTGIGVAPENRERIFERFFRVDKSRSKKTGGTGLGLAIVRHIVDAHRASIKVDSREGEGTCITVVFPDERADA